MSRRITFQATIVVETEDNAPGSEIEALRDYIADNDIETAFDIIDVEEEAS